MNRTIDRLSLSLLVSLTGCLGTPGSDGEGNVTLATTSACVASPERSITSYGYEGRQNTVQIVSSNYDALRSRLVYRATIETTTTGAPTCSPLYTIYVPTALGADAFGATVVSSTGATQGAIAWTAGAVPTVTNASGASLTSGARGPFVVTGAMAASMADTNVYVLLDARVLSALPRSARYNGAPVTGPTAATVQAAYDATLASKAHEIGTFRFRADLGDMDPAAQARAADVIAAYVQMPAEYADHGGTEPDAPLWEDHHHIDHMTAYADTIPDPADGSGTGVMGGFWNGHRIYLQGAEAHLETLSNAERVPFRRVPSWDPVDTIPGAFGALVGDASGGAGHDIATEIPNARASSVCASFQPASSSYTDVTAMRRALLGYVSPWHVNMHRDVDMGTSADRVAESPIFWPWHTTVDVILQNFESCGYIRSTAPVETSW